jgi:restriction endonuclease S subunit
MFTFSNKIDSLQEKLFLLKRSDIEERNDPEYYRPRHYRDIKLLEDSPYKLTTLDEVCSRIVDGPFGSAIKSDDYVEDGIPFIRVADVTRGEGTIKTKEMIYISYEAHQKINRSKVVPGDVVIAKTGATMGAASVIPESLPEANIRGDLGAMTTKEGVLPEYLFSFINTNIGQRLFWRLNSGGTRGRVVIGNLKKYPIVIPPLNKQEEIINLMNQAYMEKKKVDAKILELLSSIDDYLLDMLKLPELKAIKNIKGKAIYETNFNSLFGRFDPFFHKDVFKVIEEVIDKGPFKTKRLGDIFDINRGGSPRPIKSFITEAANGLNWIKIGDTKGVVKYINKCKQKIIPEGAKFSRKVIPGDFLLSNSMSFGRPYIMNIEGYIHDGWLLFRDNTGTLNKDFMHALLGSKLMYFLFSKSTIGGVVENLNIKLVKKVKVPLPDFHTQEAIVKKVKIIHTEVEKLKIRSEEDFLFTKKKAESLILGDI